MTLSLWLSRLLTFTLRGFAVTGAAQAGVDVEKLGPPIPVTAVVGRCRRTMHRELTVFLASQASSY